MQTCGGNAPVSALLFNAALRFEEKVSLCWINAASSSCARSNFQHSPDTIRLTPEHLDEIRDSMDWQAMFGGLGLRKAEGKSKANDWWAFSPFHEEKTSSFHMGPGGLWFDFSVGEGGGAIELIQKLEGGNCFEAGRFILE